MWCVVSREQTANLLLERVLAKDAKQANAEKEREMNARDEEQVSYD
jgi:hypothetical protein